MSDLDPQPTPSDAVATEAAHAALPQAVVDELGGGDAPSVRAPAKPVSVVSWPATQLVNAVAGKPSRPISGDTVYQTMNVFEGLGGKVSSGTWHATAGKFRSNIVGYIEFCFIVEGSCRVVDPDGTVHAFGVGQHFILPDGWMGHWEVDDFVKKVYVIAEA